MTKFNKKPLLGRRSVTLGSFLKEDLPVEKPILGDLLREGYIVMLSGPRGIGKSLEALYIAYAVAGGKALPPWSPKPGDGAVVVYLDAEMRQGSLQKRLSMIANRDTKTRERADRNFHLINRDHQGHHIGFIDEVEGQRRIEGLLPEGCKLLVIDNKSAWSKGGGEDASSFAVIKVWLQSLRARGIAVILVHHTNKAGGQRGSSVHEDLLDVSILLKEDPNPRPDSGTSFILVHTKLRELVPGLRKEFRVVLSTKPADGLQREYLDREALVVASTQSERAQKIQELLDEGHRPRKIADVLGVDPSTISRAIKALGLRPRAAGDDMGLPSD